VRRIIALITVAAMLVFVVSPAQAQELSLHRHLLTTPGASNIEVAQGICKQGERLIEPTLVNVHEHFHLGQPTAAFATNPVSEVAAPCP
jgi:hypothetical protein